MAKLFPGVSAHDYQQPSSGEGTEPALCFRGLKPIHSSIKKLLNKPGNGCGISSGVGAAGAGPMLTLSFEALSFNRDFPEGCQD